jgi:diaminopimelate epimerase
MNWPFAKYVACGNDFILFDNRLGMFPWAQPALIQRLCHRQWGIGADGILLMENSTKADFRMRIFNSNGSEAEMCGNGLRCFVKWLASTGFQSETYRIEVMHRTLTARYLGDTVSVEMGCPVDIQWDISVPYQKQRLFVHHLDTGVPHAVIFMKNIDQLNFEELGIFIRHHPHWMPKGTNLTVAEQLDSQKFKVRTYERGVEKETLACGTGATAVALAGAYQYQLSSPITIQTSSGEELTIAFTIQDKRFSRVTLIGYAQLTFLGKIDLPENDKISSFSIACNSVYSLKS